MARLLELYERFVSVFPDRSKALLERCEELTNRYRPADGERNLTCVEAAKRIGVIRQRVFQLYQQGRLGACIDGKPRFSEKECDVYRDGYRKPGLKPRDLTEPS